MFEQLYNALLNAINNQQNQFLSGGLVLMMVGAAAAYARRLPSRIYHWSLNRFIITLDVTNEDPAFFWFAGWLSQQPYSRRARNLSVTTYRDHYGNLRNRRGGGETQCTPASSQPEYHLPEIILTPAPGHHLLFYKRRPLWLVRNRNNPQQDKNGGFNSFFTQESFQIRMIARKQTTALALIEEMRALSIVEKEDRTDIYMMSYDSFRRVDACEPRPLSSVFLPEGQVEAIIHDLQWFLANKEWYRRRGIPWRRGHFYYGVTGGGKTTVIRAAAAYLKLDLYLINLSSIVNDAQLHNLFSSIPPRAAILLEDADAAFQGRERNKDAESSLSFSALLNNLDGVAAREGWMVFMTTNHKERLDPALIRPGRADFHLEFKTATAYQGSAIFNAFFPDSDGASMFGKIVEERSMTMAEVQQHLIIHQNSAVEALAALELPEAMEEVA